MCSSHHSEPLSKMGWPELLHCNDFPLQVISILWGGHIQNKRLTFSQEGLVPLRREWYLEAKIWGRVCLTPVQRGHQALLRHLHPHLFLYLTVCIDNPKFMLICPFLIQHQRVYRTVFPQK